MTILYNTGDWFSLGQNNDFRKFDVYDLEWIQNANLDNMLVIGAPYGGPIAITKNPTLFNQVPTSYKPIIKIFTSSGIPLGSITVSTYMHISVSAHVNKKISNLLITVEGWILDENWMVRF